MGWGGVEWNGWGGVGGEKKICLGRPMSSHDTHTVANDTPVNHRVSGSKPRLHCPIGVLHWCHCSSCDFGRSENALQKSRTVNIFNT